MRFNHGLSFVLLLGISVLTPSVRANGRIGLGCDVVVGTVFCAMSLLPSVVGATAAAPQRWSVQDFAVADLDFANAPLSPKEPRRKAEAPVRNASDFEDLPCMRVKERFDTIQTILSLPLFVGMPGLPPPPPISDAVDIVSAASFDPEALLMAVPGVGFFKSVKDVVEYNYMGLPAFNGNVYGTARRWLSNIECFEGKEDGVTASFVEEVYLNLEKVSPEGGAPNEVLLYFAPDSPLLLNYTSAFNSSLVESSLISGQDFCAEVSLRCEGDLFPYRDLDECYEFVSLIPASCDVDCPECWEKNAKFQGDTRICRNLHLIGTKFDPMWHCPHLKIISEKCRTELCPSATRLPADAADESTFDAGLSLWFRIAELVVAVLAFLIPIFTFFWYRLLRTKISNKYDQAMDASLKRTERDEQEKLPVWRCSFVLSWKQAIDGDDGIVFQAKGLELGGEKLIGLVGPSGCGKSSFMKLLNGYPQPHMKLGMTKDSKMTHNIAFSPQSSSMWPDFMRVRDILLFACSINGTHPDDFASSFKILQLNELMDQPFSSLSGGQQQRVHLMASILRPKPSIIFLDEPMAALDEENAASVLLLLKSLPTNHSFVITIHQNSPTLLSLFDRIFEIDVTNKRILSATQRERTAGVSASVQASNKPEAPATGQTSASQDHEEVEQDKTESSELVETGLLLDHDGSGTMLESDRSQRYVSFWMGFKSLLILWHAEFWGLPIIEAGILVISVIDALLIGFMGEQSLYSSTDPLYSDGIPTDWASRISYYMMQILASLSLITAFGVSSLFAAKEKHLINHYIVQKDLKISAVITLNALRSMCLGLMQSAMQVLISFALMRLIFDEVDTVLMNTSFYVSSFTLLGYSIAVLVPTEYAPHALLLVLTPMFLFNGIFFVWDELSNFFKFWHYVNPLFYALMANTNLIYSAFDANCADKAYPYLICAPGHILINIESIQEIKSLYSQLFSAVVFLGGCLLLWWTVLPRRTIETVDDATASSLSLKPVHSRGWSTHIRRRASSRSTWKAVCADSLGPSATGSQPVGQSAFHPSPKSGMAAVLEDPLESSETSDNEEEF